MTVSIRVVPFAVIVFLATLFATDAFPHDDHDPPLFGAIFPKLSPDGETIAFAHQGAIWQVARTGGTMSRLTRNHGFDTWPTWSPDGKRIAYVTAGRAVRLIQSSDGKEIQMPQRPTARRKLSFSPDGNRLLGVFDRPGGRSSLCWFDIRSGSLGDELYASKPGLTYGLSHDGMTIALSTSHDINSEQGGNNGPQCDLWILSATGGEAKKLAEFPGRVYDVIWNVDGRSLIVVSNVGGAHNDLWQVRIDDPVRSTKKLTFGQADEDSPSLDSDGRWLVYTDNRHGPTALIVRDIRTSRNSVVTVEGRDFGAATGRLLLEVRDAHTDESTTARVSIRDEHGKYYAPPDALYRMHRQDLHFYCEGTANFELPAGPYVLKAARGPEYAVINREFSVHADGKVQQLLNLERWTHQRAKGWYSGESHIHANYGYGEWYNSPQTMLAQSAGEDLIVSNFMVANSESDGVFDREFFRGSPDPISNDETVLYWNQEFRSTIWGHMTLLNLKQLVEPIFTGFARTTNPHDHPTNADIADHTHDQDGHVNYTHPARNVKDPYLSAYSAKALPIDVALGKVDSIDVMGSNHEANIPLWYRLLNCGFRVPASAGTDCFLNRIYSGLPGQVRAYVYVDDEFTYRRWIESLRAGRTFVTSGPMFEFTVDGQMAGSTIKRNEPGAVRVRGRMSAQYPLDRLEIVVNGEVVHTVTPETPSQDVAIDVDIPVTQTGWIAMRGGGPAHPHHVGGPLFGHTSAVYLDFGTRIDAKADAAYFVGWIDRLRTEIRKRNRIPGRHHVHVESQIAQAREVFNRLLAAED